MPEFGSYIPEYKGLAEAYSQYMRPREEEELSGLTESFLAGGGRTPGALLEARRKMGEGFGRERVKTFAELFAQEAGLGREERLGTQTQKWREAEMFGGEGASGTLLGQLPWQAKEAEVGFGRQKELVGVQTEAQKNLMEFQEKLKEKYGPGLFEKIMGFVGQVGGQAAGIYTGGKLLPKLFGTV